MSSTAASSAHQLDGNEVLRPIAEGTASVTGAEFFSALVQHLAVALNVRFAFVSEFADTKMRVRTLAFWYDDRFLENFEYELDGTPCEAVLAGEVTCYPTGVADRFPGHRELKDMGAESYLAIPLLDSSKNVLGHLAVIHDRPMDAQPRHMSIFQIFGARAAAELQRIRAEQALSRSEERLATILASAMDVIINIDASRQITLFNAAAEQVFRCSAAWAIGQPFDRFLSRPFRALLDSSLQNIKNGELSRSQVWAPQGLTALRADGEEFPIEATLSPLEVGGKRFYTIILRDVNDRKRAEAELQRLKLEKTYLEEEIRSAHNYGEIISDAPAMRDLLANVEKVARTDSTVLINGETGTGKELIAHALHALSRRQGKPLIKMNCAALPSELIESELFGHEKGAFTGATGQRAGRFELANGGTLFLDEVGELSAPAQAKLLRVLQDQEFERVGGTKSIKVDVRVIAATNRNLVQMVSDGTFRSDLFYRLNVFPLHVPPLRERKTDIPLLVQHFVGKLGRKLGKSFHSVSAQALERLLAYSWPGNIRELQNVMERAAILSSGPLVEVADALTPPTGATHRSLDTGTLEDVERNHIQRVLQSTQWVIEGERGAALILGLNPSTLRFRMQKLGIKKPRPGA